MLNRSTARLHEAIAAICPIVGVSVGTIGDSSTVRVVFADSATAQQMADAQAVVNAFDWSDQAQTTWLALQQPERKSLKDAASQAVTDNLAFLADATVTQAEAVVQVKALTRQVNRIIALLAKG